MADPWHAVLIITSGAQTSIPATHRVDTLDIYTLEIHTLDIYTLDIYTPWISTHPGYLHTLDIYTDK